MNRPYDDQTQSRIHLEAEAILFIIQHCQKQEWKWIGSDILKFEVEQIPNFEKKNRVQLLMSYISYVIPLYDGDRQRGKELEALGFHTLDALHLACAEKEKINVLSHIEQLKL